MNDTPFPLALADDVPAGTVTGTRLNGVEIALWRDPDGGVHVWRDLCPHRGMRLSLGFLRDGALACPYHGWRFDASGRCVHIPAHPRAVPPAAVAVPRYHVAEASGVIWAASEPFAAPTATEAATPVRSVTIQREQAVVTEALEARMFAAERWGYRSGEVKAAIQPVDEQVTAVHTVHLGPAPADVITSLARQLARLREDLETALVPA